MLSAKVISFSAVATELMFLLWKPSRDSGHGRIGEAPIYTASLRLPGGAHKLAAVGASGEGVHHAHRAKITNRRVPSIRAALLRNAARIDGTL